MGIGHQMSRRAVFLDRDGVLNKPLIGDGNPLAPCELDDFELLPDAAGACAALRNAGFLLIVVSNQPAVARGRIKRETVDEMHARLRAAIALDDIRVCYHDDRDGCFCRKPKPGLILAAARDWQVDVAASFLAGDRWRDIEAGRRAGCRTILIDYGYQETLPHAPDHVVHSLAEAAAWILKR